MLVCCLVCWMRGVPYRHMLTHRLGHEMVYNAGREACTHPSPPLTIINIIQAKRGEVSQSMETGAGRHRDRVSRKLSRAVPINGNWCGTALGQGVLQAVPRCPNQGRLMRDGIGAGCPARCPALSRSMETGAGRHQDIVSHKVSRAAPINGN